MPVGRLKPAFFKNQTKTNMIVTTDDSSTLIQLARMGHITDLKLRFSWRFFTFVYEIKTNL